jgi:hypothetical protein
MRLAVAVEAERRHDRHHALADHRLELLHVDLLDLAGKEMIDALQMPTGCASMPLQQAARRSLAASPSRISCVSRVAAVIARSSVAAIGDAGALGV